MQGCPPTSTRGTHPAGLNLNLSVPVAAVAWPWGTSSVGDSALPKGWVGPIKPHGRISLASIHWNTGLWHSHSSSFHKAEPALQVPITLLGSFCILCASRGIIQVDIVLAGVKAEWGLWSPRSAALQIQHIGTDGGGGISVTWKAIVYLGLLRNPRAYRTFIPRHTLF